MKKVVIIEDNRVIQHLLSSQLSDDDYKVECLDSFDNLMDKIKLIDPDLIITDIMLPNGNVTEMIKTYQDLKCPIIVLSSMDNEDVEYFATEIGAIAAFTKPVNMNDIVEFINEYFLKMSL